MLWYKSWLETRYKLFVMFVLMGVMMGLQYSAVRSPIQAGARPGGLGLVAVFSMLSFLSFIIMAGAGIATQTLLATKGLHGSMQYTLTLPVSRFRMLIVRSGMGWLEAVAGISVLCCVMWLLFPEWHAMGTPLEMTKYVATLIACTSAIYSLSVLFATFLHDQARAYSSMLITVLLFWLSLHEHLPVAVDLFRAMGKGSPLIAHTMPWTPMIISMVLSVVFFLAALQVARRREY